MAEQLTPTELNPDCMEQATTDWIMDTQIKNTCQQKIQLYQVVKAGQLLHQGKWPTRSFLISWRNSTQWGPLLPNGGGMIQEDTGGHPPIPLGPPPLFLSVFQFPENCQK